MLQNHDFDLELERKYNSVCDETDETDNGSDGTESSSGSSSEVSKSESYWVDSSNDNNNNNNNLAVVQYERQPQAVQRIIDENEHNYHKDLNIALLAFICETAALNDLNKKDYVFERILDFIGIRSDPKSEYRSSPRYEKTLQTIFGAAKQFAKDYDNSKIRSTKSLPAIHHSLTNEKSLVSVQDYNNHESNIHLLVSKRLESIDKKIFGIHNGGFYLNEELGHGGFGSVHKCSRISDDKKFALKFINWPIFSDRNPKFDPYNVADNDNFCVKILKEFQHLRMLDNHPNIVQYYDYWFEKNENREMDENKNNTADCGLVNLKRVNSFGQLGAVIEEVNSDHEENNSIKSFEASGPRIQSLASSPELQNYPSRSVSPCVFSVGERSDDDEEDEIDDNHLSESSNSYCGQDHGDYTESLSFHGSVEKPYWRLCILMQLCELNLSEYIKNRNNKLSRILPDSVEYSTSKNIFKQIVKGLEYIHDHNIIHRDIKPANIFLNRVEEDNNNNNYRVMIGDFGLSTTTNSQSSSTSKLSHSKSVSVNCTEIRNNSLTDFQTFTDNVGTASYAAPEQLNTKVYGKKADIYPLGLILLELMIPFQTATERIMEIMLIRKSDDILSSYFDHLPWPDEDVRNLVHKLLQNDPLNRIGCSKDILQEPFFKTQETKNVESLIKENTELKLRIEELENINKKLRDKNQELQNKYEESEKLRLKAIIDKK